MRTLLTAACVTTLLLLSPAAIAQDAPAVDPAAAVAGEYKSDPGHAYITFHYDHQGYSRPYIRWRKWDGVLNWNPETVEKSSVNVTIDATSIDSGVDRFDEHLKSADFFDVEKHGTISFVSTKVEKTGDTTGVITGDLTVKEITKSVSLDVTLNRAAADKGHKLGFSGATKIKRSDFGVGKYAPFVGDDVDIIIEAEFVKPDAK